MRSSIRLGTWALALLAGVVGLGANAQERQPPFDTSILTSGKWQGVWISHSKKSSGYVFLAELQMTVEAGNVVKGQINWTLKQTPPDSHLAKKLNATAVEFVSGKFDPASRLLILDGIKKDDPQEIVALDKYRLILAENNRVIGGITASQDTWQGLISLSLKAPEKK
jgi:hypothetical protein